MGGQGCRWGGGVGEKFENSGNWFTAECNVQRQYGFDGGRLDVGTVVMEDSFAMLNVGAFEEPTEDR